MAAKRVVITGAGPVSAIGIGRQSFFDGLNAGRSGIGPLTEFPTDRLTGKFAAEIHGFDVRDYLETEKTYLDRASQFAFAAMSLAIEDANLDLKKMDRPAFGLILGSAVGCLGSTQLFFNDFLEKGPRFVKPILFPHTYANTTISLLAIEYGLEGYHLAFASGATSAAGAMMQAYDLIRTGRNPLVFAGGVEALSPMLLGGYESVLGEGAGMLVMEDADHARQRGAPVLGEILGGGMTGGDLSTTMRLACKNLPDGCGNVARISAATPGGELDGTEAAAIRAFLGDRADKVPVDSLKTLLGETLGADAALRCIAALNAEPSGATLVNSIDPGGNTVCLAVTSHASRLTPHVCP
jgi:3-oxoacyl-[acyl-carrier-protein] synthase II